jgi:anti-sigma B factor antagonist
MGMAGFETGTGPDDVPVLRVSGDLDLADEQELLDRATRLLENDAPVVDVDLGAVTFIDSSGLGALVRAHHLAADSGRELRLAAVPAPVSRVLELSGLRGLFTERPAS